MEDTNPVQQGKQTDDNRCKNPGIAASQAAHGYQGQQHSVKKRG